MELVMELAPRLARSARELARGLVQRSVQMLAPWSAQRLVRRSVHRLVPSLVQALAPNLVQELGSLWELLLL